MTEYAVFACASAAIGLVGFLAGRASKESPSEETMMQRLMKLRMDTKDENAMRDDLERRINPGRL